MLDGDGVSFLSRPYHSRSHEVFNLARNRFFYTFFIRHGDGQLLQSLAIFYLLLPFLDIVEYHCKMV